MSSLTKRWPAETDEACPGPFVTIPPQPKQRKPGQLNDEQIKAFFEDGFVVIDEFFRKEELEPIMNDINEMVDALATALYNAGKIKDLHSDKGYHERLIAIEQEFPGANILPHKLGVQPDSVRALWTNARVLNVMEQLLGTEDIQGHPVWNLRTKTPNNTASTVPWHQDVAYLDNDSYRVLQVSAWIPLIDTNEENGCLQMVRGGHRSGRVATHTGCWEDTWYVELGEEEMEKTLDVNMERDVVTCPVPLGGMLLFNNMIPHRSLNNRCPGVTRWTMDLRWQRMDQPVGFHGLKQGVQFRSNDPGFTPNYDALRSEGYRKALQTLQKLNDFDTTIAGPWMSGRWETTHENRHTRAAAAIAENASTYHIAK